MITAVASFFILLYNHYKQRQMAAENILRAIVFNAGAIDDLVETIIAEMAKIYKGISFRLKSADKG